MITDMVTVLKLCSSKNHSKGKGDKITFFILQGGDCYFAR